MMKCIVTGGAGFIGSHLQDRLVSLGHDVLVIDNMRSGKAENLNPKAKFIEVDIRDKARIHQIFNEFQPNVVFHLAAQNEVPYSMEHPEEDLDMNINGTLNLLNAANSLQKKPKFIYSNTGGAYYGDVDADMVPIKEDNPVTKPTCFYGVSKTCAEIYLKLFGHVYGIPWVALRYANVYGPRQDGNREAGVVAIFTNKMLKGEVPTIFGDGSHTRDYVFVDDVVDANIAALNYDKNDYFNVSTEVQTSNKQVFDTLESVINTGLKVIYGPARSGDALISALSAQKALNLMGWKAKTSFLEGIRQTVAYYKK